MKILLDLLYKNIRKTFYKEKCNCYKKYINGFYVYAEPKKFKNIKSGIEYLSRYCGRLPISENRIISCDGNNVTFCYNANEDESYNEITVSAQKFILLLLRHLIPSNYKIIRYYGFYRKKHKLHNTITLLIDKTIKMERKNNLKYEKCIEISFKRNPYNCPKCKYKFEAPIEAVHEFEEEDEWNGLPISTPPFTICSKCNYDKCVPIDYKSRRVFHHIYKENN